MTAKYLDDSVSIMPRGFSRLEDRTTPISRKKWIDGEVCTPYGIVTCMAQGHDGEAPKFTRLDFCFNGRLYMRSFRGKSFSKRGIKTKAYEFAKEVGG